MKLHASVDDFHCDVELRREGDRVFARVNNRQYDLRIHQTRAGQIVLTSNGRIFNCRVEGQPSSAQLLHVIVGPKEYAVTITDPKRLRGGVEAGAHADGAARIVAPMPGRVVRLMVSVGDTVESGAGIVIVEAMKMQNEMKSPKAGIITGLNVEVGATVNGGEILAVVE